MFLKTSTKPLADSIYGIMSAQSVMLTKIGRSLETELPLNKIEERFCRQLKK
jgi:hypothetical protein